MSPSRPTPPTPARRAAAAQRWDPARYQRNAGFVPELGRPAVALLAPRSGERILDLGCGDGVLTEALVGAGARVIGVDASPEQVAAARRRGLDARVMDGARLAFERMFDAVFSNAALHWMTDPGAVVAGVRRALVPGGRFVGEFGGAGNCAAVRAALDTALAARGLDAAAADPWYFPTPEEYAAVLRDAGFRVDVIDLIPRPTRLPGPLQDWLETFAEAFLGLVGPAERPQLMADVAARLADGLRDDAGTWTVDYVRLRFAATLES